MKRLVPFILVLLVAACQEISYKTPQPRGKKSLTEIPAELRGTYMAATVDGSSKDTIIISARGYRSVSDKRESVLSDSLVLKKFKGYYFISFNDNPEWLLRLVKPQSNGDLTFYAMDADERHFDSLIARLALDVHVDSVQHGSETLYQIDPTPAQLMKLIRKGYFNRASLMKKIAPANATVH